MNETLDPTIKNLASAIKKQESGTTSDPYNAKGASGEHGAYQFMPNTWKAWAGKHLGNANAPLTVENQNKVAYNQIKEWKDKGYNPAQIAAAWNAGEGSVTGDKWKTNVGTNKLGVKYDTPSYVKNVSQYYNELKGNTQQTIQQPNTSPEGIDLSPLGKTNDIKLTGLPIVNPEEHPYVSTAIGLPSAAARGFLKSTLGNLGDITAGVANEFRDIPETGIEGQRPLGYSKSGQKLTTGETGLQLGAKLGETAFNVYLPGQGAVIKEVAQTGLRPLINTVVKNALPSIAEKRIGTSAFGAGMMGSSYVAENSEQETGDLLMGAGLEAGKGAIAGPIFDLLGTSFIRTIGKFGGDRKLINDLADAVEKNDTARIEAIRNSPEYTKWQPIVEKEAKLERDRLNTLIQDLDTTTGYTGEVKESLRKNPEEGDDAIKMAQEAYAKSSKAGGSFDDAISRVADERGVYATKGQEIVNEITKSKFDPVRDVTPQEFIDEAVNNLPTTYNEVGGIAGNTMSRERAINAIKDEVSSNLEKGQLTLNKLDTYRLKGNEDFGSDTFKADVSQALARASRATVDKITTKLEGIGNDTILGLLKQYNDYRKLQATSYLAEKVTKVLAKAFKENPSQVVSKGAGFLGTSAGDNILTKTAGYLAAKSGADTIQRALAKHTLKSYMGSKGSKLSKTLSEGAGANADKLIQDLATKGKKFKSEAEKNKAVEALINTLERNKRKLLPSGEGKTPIAMPDPKQFNPDGSMKQPTVTVTDAAKNPVSVNPKTGKFQKSFNSNPRGMSTPESLAALGVVGATGMEAYDKMQADSKYTAEQSTVEEPFMKPIVNESGIKQNEQENNGIISGINFKQYATKDSHEKDIKNIYDRLPEVSTPEDAQKEIDRLKNSYGHKIPVTGKMIANAAKEYKVPMKLMMAIMQNDSMFGTTGDGSKTNNPGNVGNDDAGNRMYYLTWNDGVRATARQLARFRINQAENKGLDMVGNGIRIPAKK